MKNTKNRRDLRRCSVPRRCFIVLWKIFLDLFHHFTHSTSSKKHTGSYKCFAQVTKNARKWAFLVILCYFNTWNIAVEWNGQYVPYTIGDIKLNTIRLKQKIKVWSFLPKFTFISDKWQKLWTDWRFFQKMWTRPILGCSHFVFFDMVLLIKLLLTN